MAKKQKYYQRKDGLFETIRTINGKRAAFRGKTCREVDQKLLAYRGEQERGRLFPKVADEWEREHEKTVRESTRVTYRVSLQRIKAHFTGPIREIRPMDVKRYLRTRWGAALPNPPCAPAGTEHPLRVCSIPAGQVLSPPNWRSR